MHAIGICLALAVSAPPSADFQDLFNGKNLEGWVVEGTDKDKDGNPVWSVKDGNIRCQGTGGGFLRFDRQQYSDFTYRVEYRFDAKPTNEPKAKIGNSGLGIRTMPYDPKNSTLSRPSFYSYEIQLLDDAGKPADAHGTASLYRYKAPTANVVKPSPEWNTIEVTCVGPKISITMNGQKVLEADQTELADLPEKQKPKGLAAPKDKPLKGYVSLQNHGSKVEFRKVQIQDLAK